MRAGSMDRRITIQKLVTTVDPVYGPQTNPDNWVDVVSRLPAQVVDTLPSQSESVEGDLRIAQSPARVRIRYTRIVSSDMRVILHGETDEIYEISGGPAEIGRREATELTIKRYST